MLTMKMISIFSNENEALVKLCYYYVIVAVFLEVSMDSTHPSEQENELNSMEKKTHVEVHFDS